MRVRLDQLVGRFLRATNDPREVVTDVHARYFGAELKFAGCDMIIFEGMSPKPVFLTVFAVAVEGSTVWVDLGAPSAADLQTVAGALGLHELAVEDALQSRQRPKVDEYDGSCYVTAYSVSLSGASLSTAELGIFLAPKAVVSAGPPQTWNGFISSAIFTASTVAGAGASFLGAAAAGALGVSAGAAFAGGAAA